jgi:hypothetical protein
MRFDFAKNDADKADEDFEYEFEVFQLPNARGDGEEDYAAVRPSEELLLTLTQDVYLLQDSPESSVDILNRIMLQAFNAADIREALIELDDPKYLDTEGDGDGVLNLVGINLERTQQRLSYRRATNPKRDALGTQTLAQVAVWLVEKWSGKVIGKPQDFLQPQKPTGGRSKRTSSSRQAATRSRSSAKSGSAGS